MPEPVKVKDQDFYLVAMITIVAFGVLILFGIAVFFFTDFIKFDRTIYGEDTSNGYFGEALLLRERRVTFSILLRTFITGFSFVVGLALSAIGGVFILRQVLSTTTISAGQGNSPPVAGKDGAPAPAPVVTPQSWWVNLGASSPGVVFMLGGIMSMFLPQYFAWPIRTIEVYPVQSVSFCPDPDDATRLVSCVRLQELQRMDHENALRITGQDNAAVTIVPRGRNAGAEAAAARPDRCAADPDGIGCQGD